jgi:hypothetical protein
MFPQIEQINAENKSYKIEKQRSDIYRGQEMYCKNNYRN